jgi:predicted pyridoxine 5'-phosphate oxidase superfamily flavin-nucleotide-binding protein
MRAFTQIAFTDAVKLMQEWNGSREANELLALREPARDELTEDVIDFIAERDSFFLATASADGWPYIQHRGGPRGFLRVLDARTLAFADFAGNRQYITVGNLSENDKVMLFLMDCNERRRLKIWGRAQVIDDEPALAAKVSHANYGARVERVIRISVLAWDFNCHQHISSR